MDFDNLEGGELNMSDKMIDSNLRKMKWLFTGMFIIFVIDRSSFIVDTVAEPTLFDLLIMMGGLSMLLTSLIVGTVSVYFLTVWGIGLHNRKIADDDSFIDVVVPALIWPHHALMAKIRGDNNGS